MELRQLGTTGLAVSRIGFGVLPMGASQKNLSVDEGSELIVYAMERGINFFDTAQYYDTYRFMRPAFDAVRKGIGNARRKGVDPVVSSKCLYSDRRSMELAVEEARFDLDIDVIDIFLLHEVKSESDFNDRRGAWEYLLEAREKGLIRAAGISTHHEDVAEHISTIKECDVVFPLINKDGLGIRRGNGPGTAEGMCSSIGKCVGSGKGVYAMKVFGGGNLTGSYMGCLNYVKAIPGISSMVIGFASTEEIDRACEYAEGTIDPSYIPDISEKRMVINKEDCIGCLSCKARCPNDAIFLSECGLPEIDPDVCLTCGYCAPVCPTRALIMF